MRKNITSIFIHIYIYTYLYYTYACAFLWMDIAQFFPSKTDPRCKKKNYTVPASIRAFKAFMSTPPDAAVLGKVNPEVKAAIASGVGATLASVDKVKRSFSCRVLVWATLTHQRASSRISGCSSSNTGCFVVVTARIFRLGIEGQKPDLTFYTLKNVPQQRMT